MLKLNSQFLASRRTAGMILLALLLACCCLLHADRTWAAGTPLLQIGPGSSGAYINPQISYFVDESDKMTAAEVLKSASFTPTEGRTGLGLLRHAAWLRVDVKRRGLSA